MMCTCAPGENGTFKWSLIKNPERIILSALMPLFGVLEFASFSRWHRNDKIIQQVSVQFSTINFLSS